MMTHSFHYARKYLSFNIQISVPNVSVHTLCTRYIIFGNTKQVRKATCISETVNSNSVGTQDNLARGYGDFFQLLQENTDIVPSSVHDGCLSNPCQFMVLLSFDFYSMG
jgi:hypothetical protein